MGKLVIGVNDLATWCANNGEWGQRLLTEAQFDPTTVSYGSDKARYPWKCKDCGNEWEISPKSRTNSNNGCPPCGRERQKHLNVGVNDLATWCAKNREWGQHLLTEARFDPTTVTYGAAQEESWECDQQHIWNASPASRTNTRRKPICPECLKNVRWVEKGVNDLATWCAKNGERGKRLLTEARFDPTTVAYASAKARYPWKCQDCGHKWPATCGNRTARGSNCPACSKRGFKALGEGWVYRFRFTDDQRKATCFGKTNDIERRIRNYRSPRHGLRGIRDVETLHVGNGDDATGIETLILNLMTTHHIPTCGENGVTTVGAVKEAFYRDEATPEFIAEFDAIWEQARQQADLLSGEPSCADS